MRKLICCVASLLLVHIALAATEMVNGIRWTYQGWRDEASVAAGSYAPAISTEITGVVTIPSSLGGYKVTSVGDYAFYHCSGLTDVSIPNGVTSIGDYAFSGCSKLTAVTIPSSVMSIGSWAFFDCSESLLIRVGWMI